MNEKMTAEKAIEQLEDLIKEAESHMTGNKIDDEIPIDDKTALEMAIQALEKQVPKKPYYRKEEGAEGYACPYCNVGVTIHLYGGGFINQEFCSNCGQALDWSDENE